MSVVETAVRLASSGPTVHSSDVVTWSVRNIIPLILMVIGITIIAGARKGRMSENANTLTNVMVGSAVIGGAALFYAFANQLTQLFFGS